MFTINLRRRNQINAMCVTLQDVVPGDTMTYKELADTYGVDPQEGVGYSLVYAAREKLLRDKGIVFVPKIGEGLLRIANGDVVISQNRRKRIMGQVRRRKRELEGVDANVLDPGEKNTLLAELQVNEMTAAMTKRRIRKRLADEIKKSGDGQAEITFVDLMKKLK